MTGRRIVRRAGHTRRTEGIPSHGEYPPVLLFTFPSAKSDGDGDSLLPSACHRSGIKDHSTTINRSCRCDPDRARIVIHDPPLASGRPQWQSSTPVARQDESCCRPSPTTPKPATAGSSAPDETSCLVRGIFVQSKSLPDVPLALVHLTNRGLTWGNAWPGIRQRESPVPLRTFPWYTRLPWSDTDFSPMYQRYHRSGTFL